MTIESRAVSANHEPETWGTEPRHHAASSAVDIANAGSEGRLRPPNTASTRSQRGSTDDGNIATRNSRETVGHRDQSEILRVISGSTNCYPIEGKKGTRPQTLPGKRPFRISQTNRPETNNSVPEKR